MSTGWETSEHDLVGLIADRAAKHCVRRYARQEGAHLAHRLGGDTPLLDGRAPGIRQPLGCSSDRRDGHKSVCVNFIAGYHPPR